jgi:uncharacterized protein
VNLDGSAVLAAPPEQVWAVITDPAVLARTIPGCVSLEQVGEDRFAMVVSAGVGAIRGMYAGEVRLSDLSFPTSCVLHASGSGGPGSVRATVPITLAPVDGGTLLSYSAEAVVGGPVAGVGQRMITGVAKKMAEQFFSAMDRELVEPNVVAAVAPALFVGPDGSAEPSVPSPPASPAPGGWIPAEAKPLLVGAAGGGLLTLLGVWIGWLLGRRR